MDDLKDKNPSAKVDFGPIEIIHRGADGWIEFSRKQGGAFKKIGGFRIDELKNYFPELVSQLEEDSYFTINTLYRPKWTQGKSVKGTGYPLVSRAEQWLRYLNVCYADLDVGRPKEDYPANPEKWMTWRDAANIAGNMMDLGDLPQASIIARSGRGAYLFWVLHDVDNPKLPPRAWPERIYLYKEINAAIQGELTHLAADNIKDGSRVFRVPGSIHTKAGGGKGKEVKYLIQLDKEGRPFTYTLDELAKFFGIKPLKRTAPDTLSRQTKKAGSVPKRGKGAVVLNEKRMQDFLVIEQWQEGFRKGWRRKSLTFYGSFMRGGKIPESEALEALKKMASNCQPPYPSDSSDQSINDIIKTVWEKKFKFKNETILKTYRIDEETAEDLDLVTIIPESLKEKREAEKMSRPTRKQVRQAALQELVSVHGTRPGYRAFQKLLYQNYGITASHQTVYRDFHEMGIKLLKPGRPKGNKGDT